MGTWIQEQLVGTKDGVNQYFTITKSPIAESMMVVHQGVRLVRVSGDPLGGETQYGLQNNIVIVGTPPGASDDIWTRYWNEATTFSRLSILKVETLTITELLDYRLRPVKLSQNDSVTIADSSTLIFRRLLFNQNDAVTVTDDFQLTLSPP